MRVQPAGVEEGGASSSAAGSAQAAEVKEERPMKKARRGKHMTERHVFFLYPP